mmetsp:Transcript_77979/g.130962  ORF Transcript_77979/g.130962 Transcript_77979/m.130962 type:complete len:242 (-) Transcript_77979:1407-2132(-)
MVSDHHRHLSWPVKEPRTTSARRHEDRSLRVSVSPTRRKHVRPNGGHVFEPSHPLSRHLRLNGGAPPMYPGPCEQPHVGCRQDLARVLRRNQQLVLLFRKRLPVLHVWPPRHGPGNGRHVRRVPVPDLHFPMDGGTDRVHAAPDDGPVDPRGGRVPDLLRRDFGRDGTAIVHGFCVCLFGTLLLRRSGLYFGVDVHVQAHPDRCGRAGDVLPGHHLGALHCPRAHLQHRVGLCCVGVGGCC